MGLPAEPPRLGTAPQGYLYLGWGHGLDGAPYPSCWARGHLGGNRGKGGEAQVGTFRHRDLGRGSLGHLAPGCNCHNPYIPAQPCGPL